MGTLMMMITLTMIMRTMLMIIIMKILYNHYGENISLAVFISVYFNEIKWEKYDIK